MWGQTSWNMSDKPDNNQTEPMINNYLPLVYMYGDSWNIWNNSEYSYQYILFFCFWGCFEQMFNLGSTKYKNGNAACYNYKIWSVKMLTLKQWIYVYSRQWFLRLRKINFNPVQFRNQTQTECLVSIKFIWQVTSYGILRISN